MDFVVSAVGLWLKLSQSWTISASIWFELCWSNWFPKSGWEVTAGPSIGRAVCSVLQIKALTTRCQSVRRCETSHKIPLEFGRNHGIYQQNKKECDARLRAPERLRLGHRTRTLFVWWTPNTYDRTYSKTQWWQSLKNIYIYLGHAELEIEFFFSTIINNVLWRSASLHTSK